MASYAEQLRDPRWQKRRLEVLDRDDWECVHCGDNTTELHVHHLRYEAGKKPWDYDLCDYRALCKHCHKEQTDVTRTARAYLYDMLATDSDLGSSLLHAVSGVLFLDGHAAEAIAEICNQSCLALMSLGDTAKIHAALLECLGAVTEVHREAVRAKNQNDKA